MRSDYFPKSVRDIRPGDSVLIPGSDPFIVSAEPSWVNEATPASKRGYILVSGRTETGEPASGKVYKWNHDVLCVPSAQDRRAARERAAEQREMRSIQLRAKARSRHK
jgi:hypothetical protein